ncbi:MAG: polyprenyl synthetase family protein [Ignavibacteriales bacterium]|nr:polyprenyl synthetase family protein [Ignavibacteriales bacterium]
MNNSDKFKKLYAAERVKIDKLLTDALAKRKPLSLYEPAAYLLSNPGKRLRPFLVLIAARAAGSSFKKVYNAAVAIEMLHTFTLAHDDIMDKADKRRGFPTLHKKYGLNTAILAGDGLAAVAYEYLLKDCSINARQVLTLFTKSLVEVCEGQSLDTDFELRTDVTLPEYIEMITRKTAVMVETCCAIGAELAGAPKPVVKGLSAFGKNIGIAFQIQDDLLDIMADGAEFGKKIGGDLLEGKKTFLFLTALEKADSGTKPYFLKVIENKGIRKSEVKFYKELYTRLGVIEDAQKAIARYTNLALKSLRAVPNEEDRELFTWLAQLLIKRTN